MNKNILIGRTIVGVRNLSQEESDYLDWWGNAEILMLDDGTEIVPSRDPEGNDAGILWHCRPGELLE
ncbi:hypothetical protein N9Y00_06975 [Tateyamaria sp.]|nr:hypothetical protein [Tateyamaria sp.]